MKAKITGVDYLTLLPENDADKAILTRWDTMCPMWGGGSRRSIWHCTKTEYVMKEEAGIMSKRIYRKKTNTTIKVRLQHTDPNGDMSPLLDALSEQLEEHKSKLVGFNRPRLGTNPKYDGQQATAMYLEIDVELLRLMFASLKFTNVQRFRLRRVLGL